MGRGLRAGHTGPADRGSLAPWLPELVERASNWAQLAHANHMGCSFPGAYYDCAAAECVNANLLLKPLMVHAAHTASLARHVGAEVASNGYIH